MKSLCLLLLLPALLFAQSPLFLYSPSDMTSAPSKYVLGDWYYKQGTNNATEYYTFFIKTVDTLSPMAQDGFLNEFTAHRALILMLREKGEASLFHSIAQVKKIFSPKLIKTRVEDLLNRLTEGDLVNFDEPFKLKISEYISDAYILNELKRILLSKPDRIPDEKFRQLITGINMVLDKKTQFIKSAIGNEMTWFRFKGLLNGLEISLDSPARAKTSCSSIYL